MILPTQTLNSLINIHLRAFANEPQSAYLRHLSCSAGSFRDWTNWSQNGYFKKVKRERERAWAREREKERAWARERERILVKNSWKYKVSQEMSSCETLPSTSIPPRMGYLQQPSKASGLCLSYADPRRFPTLKSTTCSLTHYKVSVYLGLKRSLQWAKRTRRRNHGRDSWHSWRVGVEQLLERKGKI